MECFRLCSREGRIEMNSSILFYLLVAVIIIFTVRRALVRRSIVTYSPGEVEEKLKTDRNVLLLDVRTKKEWESGHMKSAHHIPLHELVRRYDELEKHKNREIICYCQTGTRSITGAIRLKRLGFKVAHMKGGIAEWNFRNLR